VTNYYSCPKPQTLPTPHWSFVVFGAIILSVVVLAVTGRYFVTARARMRTAFVNHGCCAGSGKKSGTIIGGMHWLQVAHI
jgi:hypothetical protein